MAEVKRRVASLQDLKDIWSLVRESAADIPLDLQSEAEQESVLSQLMVGCTSGLSPVAVGEGKAIVGALVTRRDEFEWGLRNSEAVHVSCAAIAPGYREQGVLQALVSEIQERKVPIFMSVKSGDKLGLADELRKLGFAHECTASNGWGDLFKWEPAAAAQPAVAAE